MARRTGDGGVDEQRVAVSGIGEHLALQLQHAEFRMQNALLLLVRSDDLVALPQLGELGAALE